MGRDPVQLTTDLPRGNAPDDAEVVKRDRALTPVEKLDMDVRRWVVAGVDDHARGREMALGGHLMNIRGE